MKTLATKYQVYRKMNPDTDGYKALEREVLSEIAGLTPGRYSEFLGCLPFMYGARGDEREILIRPEEARNLLKNIGD